MDAPRVAKFSEAELLRFRAKWACELLTNPPARGQGHAARTRDSPDVSKDEGTQSPAAGRKTRVYQADRKVPEGGSDKGGAIEGKLRKPKKRTHRATRARGEEDTGGDKRQRVDPITNGRKRNRTMSQGYQEAGRGDRRPVAEAETATGITVPTCAMYGTAGIPPQELSVGETTPPEGREDELPMTRSPVRRLRQRTGP